MNHWLQTKLFRCPKCLARYIHDRGYAHACFFCPRRLQVQANAGRLAKS